MKWVMQLVRGTVNPSELQQTRVPDAAVKYGRSVTQSSLFSAPFIHKQKQRITCSINASLLFTLWWKIRWRPLFPLCIINVSSLLYTNE